MNFYPHHIGDFDRATRHLTRLERSIYRDLLDLYYDIEGELSLDREWVCRKILARSNEESTAVEQTLNEFFTETPTGWYHARCEDEIAKYHGNNSQKSVAGKASAAKREAKRQRALNGNPTAVETPLNGTPTNHEPITINHEPEEKSTRKRAHSPSRPGDIPESVWQDFLEIRKAKRAPLTDTAMDGIRREAQKAGVTMEQAIAACCEFGWQGFNAGWYADRQVKPSGSETVYQRSMRERVAEISPSLARSAPGQNPVHFFETITAIEPLRIAK